METTKQKAPRVKKEHSGLWICGYYGTNNAWEIFADGAIFNGEGTQSFKDKINEIISCGDNVIHSVFLHPFNTISKLFETKSTKYSDTYQATVSEDKGMLKKTNVNWCLTNNRIKGNKVIYKNFSRFSQHKFEFGEHPAYTMASYLKDCFKSFGKEMRPQDWEYSYGYISMGLFYDDELCECLKQDIYSHGRNIWYTQWYNDLTRCNKGGLLNLDNTTREVFGSEYDGKSAYSGHMLIDGHFPTGKLKTALGSDERVRKFNELVSDDWWFFIHIPKDVKVPESFNRFFKDKETGDYGLEYYDYLSATECLGISKDTFIEILKQEGVRLYYCLDGWLNPKFCEKLKKFYDEKNSLDEHDPKRDVVKQILELIYGKGLQMYDFKTDGLCRHHWAQGRNYIQPHMAYHCTAAQRYRMMSIIKKANGDVKYHDTDCVVGEEKKLKKLIEEDNKRIMCENFLFYNDEKLDVGTWKNEYKEDVTQVILAPKQRIIFTKDEIVTKVAGIKKAELMANLNEILHEYDDNYDAVINYLLDNGIGEFFIRTYEFDVVNGYTTYIKTYANYSKKE